VHDFLQFGRRKVQDRKKKRSLKDYIIALFKGLQTKACHAYPEFNPSLLR